MSLYLEFTVSMYEHPRLSLAHRPQMGLASSHFVFLCLHASQALE